MKEFENGLYDVRHISDFRDMLDQSVENYGDLPAYKVKRKGKFETVTYKEFRDDVWALGSSLLKMGLQGKHIALAGSNSYEWCVAYMAVTCGLGVIVPIDKELSAEEIENVLNESDSECIICDRKIYNKLEKAGSEFIKNKKVVGIGMKPPVIKEVIALVTEGKDKREDWTTYDHLIETGRKVVETKSINFTTYRNLPIDPDALGVLLFTSGTSGMAKGVMLSQRNICFVVMSNCSTVHTGPGDQFYCVLPLHHTFECTLGFLVPLYSGCCNAFATSMIRMAKDIQEIKPTVFLSVPLMLEYMHGKIMKTIAASQGNQVAVKLAEALSKTTYEASMNVSEKLYEEVLKGFGGKLRLMIVGAAAVKPEVITSFKNLGVTSYVGYGLTECAPLVAGNNDELYTPDTVGRAIPGVEIKIENPNDEGIGEIIVKGPNVMLGYYKDEKLTAEVIDKDGWFHTGDLGTIDEDGLLRITGRAKNVIVTKNGENVYPEELEYYLNQNPFIAESMVFGEEAEDDTVVTAKIFPDFKAIAEKLSIEKDHLFSMLSKDEEEPKEEKKLSKEEKLLASEEKPESWEETVKNFLEPMIKEINDKLPSYKNIKGFSIRDTEFIKTTTEKIKRYANLDGRNDK